VPLNPVRTVDLDVGLVAVLDARQRSELRDGQHAVALIQELVDVVFNLGVVPGAG